jgi:hypothetical protein
MGESILQLRQIRKSFDNTEVLKGIDLEVAQGEFITLFIVHFYKILYFPRKHTVFHVFFLVLFYVNTPIIYCKNYFLLYSSSISGRLRAVTSMLFSFLHFSIFAW